MCKLCCHLDFDSQLAVCLSISMPFTVTVVSGKMADCPKKSMTNVKEGGIMAKLAQKSLIYEQLAPCRL